LFLLFRRPMDRSIDRSEMTCLDSNARLGATKEKVCLLKMYDILHCVREKASKCKKLLGH
jgi:hypothetical protein